MRVIVKSTFCKEVTARATGKRYFFQTAALDQGDDFPKPFEILHDDVGKAYPPGEYAFAPDAVYVDKSGKLAVSPRLVPVAKGPASVAKGV